MFAWLFPRASHQDAASRLYGLVVERARDPDFYTRLGVADTVDGRFDMIALHAFLLLHRLKAEDSAAAAGLAQALFDLMFGDMDRNLREMGVGDLSVGRKVKDMAKAFNGRVAAYDAGLAAGGDAALRDALARNLYRGADPGLDRLRVMAAYVRRTALALAPQPLAALGQGLVTFGPPPGEERQ